MALSRVCVVQSSLARKLLGSGNFGSAPNVFDRTGLVQRTLAKRKRLKKEISKISVVYARERESSVGVLFTKQVHFSSLTDAVVPVGYEDRR